MLGEAAELARLPDGRRPAEWWLLRVGSRCLLAALDGGHVTRIADVVELGHGAFGDVAAVAGDPLVVACRSRSRRPVGRRRPSSGCRRRRSGVDLLVDPLVYPALMARSDSSSRSEWTDAVQVLLEGCGNVPVSCFLRRSSRGVGRRLLA